ITRGCPTRSGSGSTNGSSTCLGSGELLRCCVLAPLGPSSVSGSTRGCPTCSGSGELLLVCVLALLGPSSASLYSCSDSVVFGVRFWEPKRSASGYGGFWCAKCSLSGLRRRSSVFYDSLNLCIRYQRFNVSLLQDVRVRW